MKKLPILLAAAALAATLQLLAGPREEEALKSLQNASGAVRIVCSPGLQTIPAGVVRLVGTDNAALKIKVESLAPAELDAEMAGGRAAFAIVDAPVAAPAVGVTLRPLAYKGTLFAVNDATGPKSLSKKDLDKAMAGKIADWSELGMPKGPIRVYSTPERLPAAFDPVVGGVEEEDSEEPEKDASGKPVKKRKHNKNPFIRRLVPVADEARALAAVEQDPCGIAAVTITAKAPKGVRFIAVDDVLPSPESFSEGLYPCAKRIYMATPAKMSVPAKNLAALLLSEGFKAELHEQGLLSARADAPERK